MPKLSKEKRDQLILVCIGTVAIIVGLWFGVIKTRNEQLGESTGRYQAALDKLDKAKARVKQGEKVEADMQAATMKLKAIEQNMAPGVDLYSWAYDLLGKVRAGHEINIIDVTRPAKGDVGLLAQFPYDAAIFSVRGTGFYHDYGKFLADFENRFPYFRVQNLTLGPGFETSSGGEGAVAHGSEEKLSFKMDVVALIKPNS